MQNAYSRQASVEVEQQIGERDAPSASATSTPRGRDLIISINQNVPSCVAAGTNNGCRPNPAYANNSQYSPRARVAAITACTLSLVQRPARWGQYRVSYTLSKAMDNVGEFFFSSPIDPFDSRQGLGPLRRRPAASPGGQRRGRRSHGFQLSGMVQAYSALPFNITSGVTTVQGTAGRPIVDGEFIPRNAGDRPRLLQRQPAPEPHVRARRSRAPRGAGRRLQPHQPRERGDGERQLRRRRLSGQSVADLRAGRRPSAIRGPFQFGVRLRF